MIENIVVARGVNTGPRRSPRHAQNEPCVVRAWRKCLVPPGLTQGAGGAWATETPLSLDAAPGACRPYRGEARAPVGYFVHLAIVHIHKLGEKENWCVSVIIESS